MRIEEAVHALSPKLSGESDVNVCFKCPNVASGRRGVFEGFEGTVIVLNVRRTQATKRRAEPHWRYFSPPVCVASHFE